MAAKSPIEMKIDRYHDRVGTYIEEVRARILEIFDHSANTNSELKEIRREFSKLRESVMQIGADVESLLRSSQQMVSLRAAGSAMAAGAEYSQQAPADPAPNQSPHIAIVPQAPVAPVEAKDNTKNLKEYFASTKSIYNVSVLNAFIKATREVVKILTETDPQFVNPSIQEHKPIPMVLAGRMKMDRDKGAGSMVIGFSKACALQMTRDILRLPEEAPMSREYLQDVASEVCNQVCGAASLAVKADGYSFRMSLPEVKSGNASDLNREYGFPQITLHFDYKGALFHILLWG